MGGGGYSKTHARPPTEVSLERHGNKMDSFGQIAGEENSTAAGQRHQKVPQHTSPETQDIHGYLKSEG